MTFIAPELRFSKFKDSWLEVPLKDICKIERGKFSPRPRNDPKFYGGEIPFVQTGDVTNSNGSIVRYTQTLNEVGLKVSKFFPKGTILITIAANIGYCGVLRIGMACPDSLIGLTTNKINHNEFLCILLNKLRKRIDYLAPQAAQKNINIEFLSPLKLKVPCIEEQQHIAGFLTSVDKKISLLKEKHALLKQYKKGSMQKLFSQKKRFKDDNDDTFPDWNEKPLEQVLEIQVREIVKPTEKYLALGIKSHMKGTFQKPNFDPNAIMMDKLFIVRPNDLVLNITFAWEGAVAIAKNEDDGGLVSHRFPTYTFKDGESTHRYFKHIITLKRFKYMLDLISPGGAGRNRVLSKKEFLKLKWNLPGIEEQLKIADFLDALDKKIELVSQEIEQTQAFKAGLLQQMFV